MTILTNNNETEYYILTDDGRDYLRNPDGKKLIWPTYEAAQEGLAIFAEPDDTTPHDILVRL